MVCHPDGEQMDASHSTPPSPLRQTGGKVISVTEDGKSDVMHHAAPQLSLASYLPSRLTGLITHAHRTSTATQAGWMVHTQHHGMVRVHTFHHAASNSCRRMPEWGPSTYNVWINSMGGSAGGHIPNV